MSLPEVSLKKTWSFNDQQTKLKTLKGNFKSKIFSSINLIKDLAVFSVKYLYIKLFFPKIKKSGISFIVTNPK